MATVPSIEVNFKQLATTLIERSERGTAILLLNETKDEVETKSFTTMVYKSVADINEELYSEENLKFIKSCLSYTPYELVVISGNSTTFKDFVPYIKKARPTGWIAFAGEYEPQADLASWIKSMELAGHTYKAVGLTDKTDCMQYVYFNQKGTDENGETVEAEDYLASLLGILANCNISRGATNYVCKDLVTVVEPEVLDKAVTAGQLVLVNDSDGVKILTGINSLTTLDGDTATEDMQYIETVEAMNLIKDDIRSEFKNTYQGRFKNKLTNQLLFIGAVINYFSELAAENVLDDEYDNTAEVDVETQKAAWIGVGRSEAVDWDDDTVRRRTFKRSVFVAADIKILNCMENLKFTVTME